MTYIEVQRLVDIICTNIRDKKYSGVYGIPRGGLVPAALIAYRLGVPVVGFRDINKNILIVDDGVNSGVTISNDAYSFCDKAVLTVRNGKQELVTYFGKIVYDYVTYPWENI